MARPVAYTFYRGESGDDFVHLHEVARLRHPPPSGAAREVADSSFYGAHNYYQYRGYSICLSYPPGDFMCVLISRRPMNQFVQDIVALAEF